MFFVTLGILRATPLNPVFLRKKKSKSEENPRQKREKTTEFVHPLNLSVIWKVKLIQTLQMMKVSFTAADTKKNVKDNTGR